MAQEEGGGGIGLGIWRILDCYFDPGVGARKNMMMTVMQVIDYSAISYPPGTAMRSNGVGGYGKTSLELKAVKRQVGICECI